MTDLCGIGSPCDLKDSVHDLLEKLEASVDKCRYREGQALIIVARMIELLNDRLDALAE